MFSIVNGGEKLDIKYLEKKILRYLFPTFV